MSIGPIDMQPFIARPTHTDRAQPAETHPVQQAQKSDEADEHEKLRAKQVTEFAESEKNKVLSEEEKRLKILEERQKKKDKDGNNEEETPDEAAEEEQNADENNEDPDKGSFFDLKA